LEAGGVFRNTKVSVVETEEASLSATSDGSLDGEIPKEETIEEEDVERRPEGSEELKNPPLTSGGVVSSKTDERRERDLEELLLVDIISAVAVVFGRCGGGGIIDCVSWKGEIKFVF
jgi:hypothetical protein